MDQDSSPSAPPAPGGLLRRLKRLVLLLVVAVVVLFGLYTWAAYHYTYSSGDRAGYVQKFSRKGWVCKTWEGELAMVNLPGAMPEIFRFTVRDDVVADQINASLGERVALHYEQHLGLPTSCFGDTTYFITGVRRVESPGPAPAGATAPGGEASPGKPGTPEEPGPPAVPAPQPSPAR